MNEIPRCAYCHARLDLVTPWNQPHICKETTFGTCVSFTSFIPLRTPEQLRDEAAAKVHLALFGEEL